MPKGPRDWAPGIKTLKTKAKDNHGYEYDVYLDLTKDSKKWVLHIDGTPGHWYMSTLLEGDWKRDRIAIDHGQGWYVENFRDIMIEAIDKI
jgi:hypothetical protein